MTAARKCNRCGVLFERKLGNLHVVEVREDSKPPKGHSGGDWSTSIINEDNPYDLCTSCSIGLRQFLKPIRRAGRDS